MTGHFIKVCENGHVISQCRCTGPKTRTVVPATQCPKCLSEAQIEIVRLSEYDEVGLEDDTLTGYISGEAPGAIPVGSRVRKINSEPGDGNTDGVLGTVISSVALTEEEKRQFGGEFDYAYFVVFDTRPVPVGVLGNRIERMTT